MPESVIQGLGVVALVGEIIGAGALVLGFLMVTARWAREARSLGALSAYDRYRKSLGRVVVIGLEILVAVTIIKTITVEATPEALGLLAVMIGIRTMLSWTTVLEMSGRWPWQRAPARNS
ncbi:MAG: DUF1622 domain-containing protein [marine benthic group bacterium]|nr:DUF1622 domain-containing protein [Gemmatimonadota bacterium]